MAAEGDKDIPVAKVTVRYTPTAESEEIILKNGVEFADWIGPMTMSPAQKDRCPASSSRGQVCVGSPKTLKHPGVIQSHHVGKFHRITKSRRRICSHHRGSRAARRSRSVSSLQA